MTVGAGGGQEGLLFLSRPKTIVCRNIMGRILLPAAATPGDWPPVKNPPLAQAELFTQQGNMPLIERVYSASTRLVYPENYWTPQGIADRGRERGAGAGETVPGEVRTQEGVTELREDLNNPFEVTKLAHTGQELMMKAVGKFGVKKMAGVVLGAGTPWLEAILLNFGASAVTVITPLPFSSTHSKISGLTPLEMARLFSDPELEVGRAAGGDAEKAAKRDQIKEGFDFVASYNYVERLGLGSFGEQLNPYGDLEAVAQVWCLLKPGGVFFLGAMTSPRSHLQFNSHRSYGPERMAFVGGGFDQVAHLGLWDGISVFVLQKPLLVSPSFFPSFFSSLLFSFLLFLERDLLPVCLSACLLACLLLLLATLKDFFFSS